MPEFYIILVRKLSKYPNFYDIWRKIYKIHEFYMIFFSRKMSEFYIIITRKIFFPNFRGTRAPLPPLPFPTPIPIAYSAIQPQVWINLVSVSDIIHCNIAFQASNPVATTSQNRWRQTGQSSLRGHDDGGWSSINELICRQKTMDERQSCRTKQTLTYTVYSWSGHLVIMFSAHPAVMSQHNDDWRFDPKNLDRFSFYV